jgi:hypothetical protein
MHPQDFATLVNQANTGQRQTFLHFETSSTSTLDTGLLNYFLTSKGVRIVRLETPYFLVKGNMANSSYQMILALCRAANAIATALP